MTIGTLNRVHAAPCWPSSDNPPPTNGPTGDVEFSYNPQDQVTMQPSTTTVHGVGQGPSVEKAAVRSDSPAPKDDKYVYEQSDSRYHTANAFAATAKTIEIFEQALGQSFDWAFRGSQLKVNGDKGDMLNAYYSRNDGSINFFHSRDSVFNRTVYSGDSGEVVSHEAGHAILDGLRPGYLSSFSPDPGGFHESFGDVLAMLVSLKDDRVLDKVIEQTGGDLSRPNVAAHLGEELGMAINHYTGGNATGGDYTRTAINNFKWQDPSTLPSRAPHDQLSREVHSYSRLWTGAFYDVFKGINEAYQAQGKSPKEALAAAADEGLHIYGSLMKTAPSGNFAYRDMAQALLRADAQFNDGKRSDLIRDVMVERRILPQSFEMAELDSANPTGELRELQTTLKGDQFGQFEGAVVRTQIDSVADIAGDSGREAKLQADVKQLIDDGRILYTTPGQSVAQSDLFDKEGNPYIGVVRWESGQMEIERVKVLA
ncbi:MAG: hypothetical protein AB7S38_36610 [Vulcanimicrobiota bacterium]